MKILKNPKSQNFILKNENCLLAIFNKSRKAKTKLNFEFDYPNSNLQFYVIIIGKKEDNFDLEIHSNHRAKKCKSNITIISALFDKSQVNFKGNIFVSGKDCEAELSHHTLLLSDHAKTSTTPSLEIKTNEVKANHKASTGKINEDVLYYLLSRGIEESEARDLLIKAFLLKDIPKNLHNKIISYV